MTGRRPNPIQIANLDAMPRRRERYFARAAGNGFRAQSDSGATKIELFDEIGAFGISLSAFSRQLPASGPIELLINSPGGSIFDGLSIYNLLVAHNGPITTRIIGVAASAASVIAMAGDTIEIAENGFLMIHLSHGFTLGNRLDHAEQIKVLSEVDDAMARTYSARTGIDVDEIDKLMVAETWFSGPDAVEQGFADKLMPAAEPSARFDLAAVYKQVPAELAWAPPPRPHGQPTRSAVERALHAVPGVSISAAKRAAAAAMPVIASAEQIAIEELTTMLAADRAKLQSMRRQ